MKERELSNYITECLVYEGLQTCLEKGMCRYCLRGMSSCIKNLRKRVRKCLHYCNSDELDIIEKLLKMETVSSKLNKGSKGLLHVSEHEDNLGHSEEIEKLKEIERRLIHIIASPVSEEISGGILLSLDKQGASVDPEEAERRREIVRHMVQTIFKLEPGEERNGIFQRLEPLELSDDPKMKALVKVLRGLIPSPKALCAYLPFDDSL